MLTRLFRGLRGLFLLALRERATPRETGLSVAVGAFSSSTPFVGFHIWMALGLATVLRLNRLWAALGSRASPPPVLALLAFSQVQLAHRLRTGHWVPLAVHEILAHSRELFLDWLLGTPLVGGAYAAALGLLAYVVARRRAAMAAADPASAGSAEVTLPVPGAAPPGTSECPPSAPPNQTA
jgi:uncharacterized protein (DUF2062 family)